MAFSPDSHAAPNFRGASAFLIDVRGGAARAPGAGVGGQRSHGRRSAADFRVSERPWRAAANVRRWGMGSPGPGAATTSVAPPAAGRRWFRRLTKATRCSSSVRRPLRLHHPLCSGRLAFRGASAAGRRWFRHLTKATRCSSSVRRPLPLHHPMDTRIYGFDRASPVSPDAMPVGVENPAS